MPGVAERVLVEDKPVLDAANHEPNGTRLCGRADKPHVIDVPVGLEPKLIVNRKNSGRNLVLFCEDLVDDVALKCAGHCEMI